MATDHSLQTFVHRIEEGKWAKWIKLGVLLAVMISMFTAFVLDPWGWGLYKGLNHPKAMEQAQIARELARGHGFSTKMIRPLAYTQIKTNMGYFASDKIPDIYHAPLWPVTLAPCLYVLNVWPEITWGSSTLPKIQQPTKDRWEMTTRDYIYVGDRMVSAVAVILFFLTVFVCYFTVRRIFDDLIGVWTVMLMLACNLFWVYALSGLPQMLMLFLFSAAVYALVRAIETQGAGLWPFWWLSITAFFLGLLTLAHGIALWIFLGAVLFCTIYFKPRMKTFILMSVIFGIIYAPWCWRNYKASHDFFGMSYYALLSQVHGGTEDTIMRSIDTDLTGVSPFMFRKKVQTQLAAQMGNFFNSFGGIMVAPAFFLALLHIFKNPVPRGLRWALFSMWFFAFFGMCVMGGDDPGVGISSNDLHLLFIPMFSAFGIAFVIVLWGRMEIHVRLVKYVFYVLIFGICTLPMLNTFTAAIGRGASPVQWPPYVPPYISILRDWTTPNEIITSDMPWAVAWYADRKSLWLPMTITSFLDFHDYERLGGKVAGIYLTPITGNGKLIGDIVKGDYKDWAPFILRNVGIKDFPLRAGTAMPIENQCIFYSDRDRWTDRAD